MIQVHGAPSIIRRRRHKVKKDHEGIKAKEKERCEISESIPLGDAKLNRNDVQCDTNALRVCAVYPCTLTPRAEYLALTLCKPIGGVVKYTTPTPLTPPTTVIGHRPSLSVASASGAATGLARSHVT